MDGQLASRELLTDQTIVGSRALNASVQPRTRLCIISPNKDTYSETFIHNHIRRLPAETTVLYGGYYPKRQGVDNKRIAPLWLRVLVAAHERANILPAAPIRQLRTSVLASYLRQHRFDVVLAEYGPTAAETYEACVRIGTPFVVHFHGFDASRNDTIAEYGVRYRDMFKSAAAIIGVSNDMVRRLNELGAPSEKLLYNPYGVDLAQFGDADPASATQQFLAVGRFVEKKGPMLTIEAFRQVFDQCPNARLTMVGDGILLDDCRRKCETLRLADAVHFMPAAPHDEISNLMKSARAFVQHSITSANGDSEGTPVAILEAAGSGLPVVSTRHNGIKEAVISGETGFLVEERDVDGMAAHMIRLAEDPELAGLLGRAARRHITQFFNMEEQIAKLWEILRAAAGQHRYESKLSVAGKH